MAQKPVVDDITAGPQRTFAGLVGSVAGRATRQFLNAGPKFWFAAILLLLFASIIGPIYFSSGQQQRTAEKTSGQTKKVPEAASNPQSPTALPPASSVVQGFAANGLLADQLEKHQKTMDALTDARDRGNTNAIIRILNLRSRELAQAIAEVNAGSYSINDKQQLLNILTQEKDWATDGAAALSQ